MYSMSAYEKEAIDGLLDDYISAGIDLSGVNFNNPAVMGAALKRFFKKVGKGIKNIASKIKQRIKERGIQANVSTTDDQKFSVGPEGVKVTTKEGSYETGPGGIRANFESQSQKDVSIPDSQPGQPAINPMFLIAGAGALVLVMMLMKK